MHNTIEFKTTRGGLRLVADAFGNPRNQTVLLLHGGGQTRHSWGDTAKLLSVQGFYAVALDLRGHGESSWAADKDYLFQTFAQDVIDVAQTFERKPISVGASLGGISSLYAHSIANHQLLHALVLVDVAPRLQIEGLSRIHEFMTLRAKEGFASLDEAADFVAAYRTHRQRSASVEGLRKNLRLCDDGRYRWHWDPDFLVYSDRLDASGSAVNVNFLEEATRGLEIPTLLVRGQVSDILSLESARQFLTLVPHAKFVDVKNAGHMVAGDQNDIFANAVVDFLRTVT